MCKIYLPCNKCPIAIAYKANKWLSEKEMSVAHSEAILKYESESE